MSVAASHGSPGSHGPVTTVFNVKYHGTTSPISNNITRDLLATAIKNIDNKVGTVTITESNKVSSFINNNTNATWTIVGGVTLTADRFISAVSSLTGSNKIILNSFSVVNPSPPPTSQTPPPGTTPPGTTSTIFDVVYNGTAPITPAQRTAFLDKLKLAVPGLTFTESRSSKTAPPGKTIQLWMFSKPVTAAQIKTAAAAMTTNKIEIFGDPTIATSGPPDRTSTSFTVSYRGTTGMTVNQRGNILKQLKKSQSSVSTLFESTPMNQPTTTGIIRRIWTFDIPLSREEVKNAVNNMTGTKIELTAYPIIRSLVIEDIRSLLKISQLIPATYSFNSTNFNDIANLIRQNDNYKTRLLQIVVMLKEELARLRNAQTDYYNDIQDRIDILRDKYDRFMVTNGEDFVNARGNIPSEEENIGYNGNIDPGQFIEEAPTGSSVASDFSKTSGATIGVASPASQYPPHPPATPQLPLQWVDPWKALHIGGRRKRSTRSKGGRR
jgi:hypothetical protein